MREYIRKMKKEHPIINRVCKLSITPLGFRKISIKIIVNKKIKKTAYSLNNFS
jgi:hypothetical protein